MLCNDKANPGTSVPVLYLTNFMTYWMTQTLLSVVFITGYAILSIVMEHNVCRFDRAVYVDDPEGLLPVFDDPN